MVYQERQEPPGMQLRVRRVIPARVNVLEAEVRALKVSVLIASQ